MSKETAMNEDDLRAIEKMVGECFNEGEGWMHGDSAPEGGFDTPEELAEELMGVVGKTLTMTPGEHTRHFWSIHAKDPLDESASLIIGHTGNGPTSEAHARFLSCAPRAVRELTREVRRLRRKCNEMHMAMQLGGTRE